MNEKPVWDYLLSKVKNPYGVAALMGNLMAESSLNPANATGKKKTADYVHDADAGRVDFANDGVAFGLVQWCYKTRKQGLLDLAKKRGLSVGNLNLQLDYMWQELQSYKTALNAVLTATNIREASDIVMLTYEKPANTSKAMKQRRAKYGQQFFDQFAGSSASPQSGSTSGAKKQKKVLATANVNIRSGNAKSYTKIDLLKKGESLPWVATSPNNWHAVEFGGHVFWVSGEYSKVTDE